MLSLHVHRTLCWQHTCTMYNMYIRNMYMYMYVSVLQESLLQVCRLGTQYQSSKSYAIGMELRHRACNGLHLHIPWLNSLSNYSYRGIPSPYLSALSVLHNFIHTWKYSIAVSQCDRTCVHSVCLKMAVWKTVLH